MAQTTMLLGSDPDEVCKLLERLGVDARMVRRVVIDICVGEIVTAYVEMYASEGSLEIIANTPAPPEVKVIP
jgi:hypothetical protein